MDVVIDFMKLKNIPLTRQNYIELAFTSDDTDLDNLDPEQEAQIPYDLLEEKKPQAGLLA